MGEGQQKVEQRDGAGLQHAQGQHRRRFGEQADQRRSGQIRQYADDLGNDGRRQDAEPRTTAGPLLLSRAQVLADVGGDGHGEAGDRQEGEALDLGVRAVGRHGVLAEGVDVGLHHHVGQGDDGVLHPGGQAVAQNLPQQRAVDPQGAPAELENGALLGQVQQAQHHADRLGDDGGDGCRPHAPAEHAHKQQVKGDVGEGRDDQVVQGAAAVAQGVHDAGEGVVHNHRADPGKVAAEVADSVIHHLGVGLHPPQQRGGEAHAHGGEEDAAEQAQQHRGVDGAGHPVIVPRAEIAGDGHTRAGGRTGEEADHQEHQRARGADGGQGVIPQESADDQRVGGVIELLKELAEKNRDGKHADETPGNAVGHVLGSGGRHGITLLSMDENSAAR